MKYFKLFAILIAALIAVQPVNAKKKKNDDSGTPVISFVEQTHDFGIIPGDKNFVSTEFEFTNTGNGPLVIYEAKAECGCTRPSYPTHPIAPGKKGKIKVTFNPHGYRGGFTKSVKLKTNAGSKVKVLKISGVVNPN